MQFNVEKSDVCFSSYKVEVDVADVQNVYKEQFRLVAKNARVNGFRKGHVPAKILMDNYGGDILNKTYNKLVQNAVSEIMKDSKLILCKHVDITNESELAEDKNFSFNVELTHEAELKLEQDFSNVELKELVSSVNEADIDDVIAKLVKNFAKLEDAGADAVFSADTIADINFCGKKDGVEFAGGKAENFELRPDANMIPGFVDSIMGHKAGDEFDINCKFPEDYHAEELKGQDAVFSIKVNSIKKEVLPEVTDEFAKEHFQVDTVAQFREELNKNMARECNKGVHTLNVSRLVDAVAALVEDFEVPAPIVEKMAQRNMLSQMSRIARQLNIDPRNLMKNMPQPKFEDLEDEEKKNYSQQYKKQAVYLAIVDSVVANLEKDAKGNAIPPKDYFDKVVDLAACAYDKADEFREEANKEGSEINASMNDEALQLYIYDTFKSKLKVESETISFQDLQKQYQGGM